MPALMENPRLQAALADPAIDADVPFRATSGHRHHTWVWRVAFDSIARVFTDEDDIGTDFPLATGAIHPPSLDT